MSLPDRIRAGHVDPWVGAGADGARRSAGVVADELATLADDDPRTAGLVEERAAWLARARDLEAEEATA